MKKIEQMAVEAVERVDYIMNENRRAYGAGFMDGFRAAREMAIQAALGSELFNQGESASVAA